MKYIHKLSVRILAALVIGFLLAGAGTKITYSCASVDGAAGCVSFDKAIMHPSDLLNNKQDSIVHFTEAFVISSLVSFAVLSIIDVAQKKPKPATQPKG
ncbi:MAG: hypothetical protein WBO35_04870 [Candidatus Saccharimonadales bacterium]